MENYINLIIKRRLAFACLSFLLIGVALIGAPNVGFNSAYKEVVDPENEYRVSLEKMENEYYSSDYIVVYLTHDRFELDSNEGIKIIEGATEQARKIPYSYRINSVTNFQHITALDNSISVEDLYSKDEEINSNKNITNIIRTDDFIAHRLTDEKGRISLIYISVNIPEGKHTATVLELSEYLKEFKNNLETESPGLNIKFGGSVIVETEMIDSAIQNGVQLAPIVLFLGMLFQTILFRSIKPYVASMSVINGSCMMVLGIVGWLGIELTIISTLSFLLILVIAIANTVHITSNYLTFLNQGHDKEESLRLSFRDNFYPLVMTSITTSIGFISLNFSDNPQFSYMGNMAAAGTIFSLCFTQFLFPFFLLIFNIKVHEEKSSLKTLTGSVIDHIIANNKKYSTFGIFAVLLCGSFIGMNKLNDDPSAYFAKGTQLYEAQEQAKEMMPGTKRMFVILEPMGGSINDPVFLADVERFRNWFLEMKSVTHVLSYTTLLKKINRSMHANNDANYVLPTNPAEAAQYFLLYELSLPFGHDTQDFVSQDQSTVRLDISLQHDLDNDALLRIKEQAQNWYQNNTQTFSAEFNSIDLMFALNGKRVLNGLLVGAMICVLLITFLISLSMRSASYGLLSIIPNVLPPLAIYGLWGILDGEVIMSAATTFTICLGIIIDDTLYILLKYVRERRVGVSCEEALRTTYMKSGPALIVTTIVLSSGSAVFCLSNFLPISVIGQMMTPIIILALVFDFFVLPGIIMFFEKYTVKELEKTI